MNDAENNNKNEVIINNELLQIFNSDVDRVGVDLLQMSDYFGLFINKTNRKVLKEASWTAAEAESLIAQISSALKTGFDISNLGTLVADYSHFSKEIIDGLKEGIYHIGISKEVNGNMRPAILDDKEQLVKFFTLKRAINPSEVLSDVNSLAMQSTLRQISSELESIKYATREMINFQRRESLSNKFIYARDRIISANQAASEDERRRLLAEADRYLMEGSMSLYSDLNAQVENLSKQRGPFAKLDNIDMHLAYIGEDMRMIPKYVGVRTYLLSYAGKEEDARRVLNDYKYQLEQLDKKKFADNKYTALELIHSYSPYDEEDMDFWLTKPKEMAKAIDSYEEGLLLQNKERIYCIEGEETTDEQ